jgi:putative restriction endonuclease
MSRGVFLHRTDSIYDDRPELQYQFPKQYLARAAQFVGDWIIYYEPVRGPTAKGYFAIARVERIIPDPSADGMYLALIEEGSYLPFERPVPFSGGPDGVVERGLLNAAGAISGRAQAAVRPISLEDFNRILLRGLPEEDPLLPESTNRWKLRPTTAYARTSANVWPITAPGSSATGCSGRLFSKPMTAAAPSPASS